MKTLLLTVPDKALLNVIAVLEQYVPLDQIKLLAEQALPSPQEEAKKAAEELAQQVARAVKPKPHQTMRPEALRFSLVNGDTFWDQKGETDPAMRNALGALSKSMRRVFPTDQSPIDRIARREKHFDKFGNYLGTRYHPTALGKRVLEILKENGAL